MLIFLHIPKCAGTTFKTILTRQYGEEKTVEVVNHIPERSLKSVIKMPTKEKQAVECLMGHIPFGIHSEFPHEDCKYITFLRNPVERVISTYFFKKADDNPVHGSFESNIDNLGDFASSDQYIEPHNLMTRLLSNRKVAFPLGAPTPQGVKPLSQSALEVAKHNLKESFTFVGFTEDFDISLLIMKKKFSWNNVYYFRKNIGRRKKGASEIKDEYLDKIRAANKLDLELYEFARRIFQREVRKYGKDLDKEVRVFQQINFIYSLPYNALRNIDYALNIRKKIKKGHGKLKDLFTRKK